MGTNFYWLEDGAEGTHIGKRSAAGAYCWDCNVTLCASGPEFVHHGHKDWHEACPKCGKTKDDTKTLPNAAMIELGFAKPSNEKQTGVGSCSSFSWAEHPDVAMQKINEHLHEEMIVDEYGRRMTCEAFINMLDNNSPIRFTRLVGKEFC